MKKLFSSLYSLLQVKKKKNLTKSCRVSFPSHHISQQIVESLEIEKKIVRWERNRSCGLRLALPSSPVPTASLGFLRKPEWLGTRHSWWYDQF
jgi:hypothetical protein